MAHMKKFLGQHFLKSSEVIQQIVELIHPKNSDFIVEIGPGSGALTVPLLKKVPSLHAIEYDHELIAPLQQLNGLIVHEANVLKFDFNTLCSSRLRLVGNLPYNISTPLLFYLIGFIDNIIDSFFLQSFFVELENVYQVVVDSAKDINQGIFLNVEKLDKKQVRLSIYLSYKKQVIMRK